MNSSTTGEGSVTTPAVEEEVLMPEEEKDRVEELLDQLKNPYLSDGQIERIERKIKILQSLET